MTLEQDEATETLRRLPRHHARWSGRTHRDLAARNGGFLGFKGCLPKPAKSSGFRWTSPLTHMRVLSVRAVFIIALASPASITRCSNWPSGKFTRRRSQNETKRRRLIS